MDKGSSIIWFILLHYDIFVPPKFIFAPSLSQAGKNPITHTFLCPITHKPYNQLCLVTNLSTLFTMNSWGAWLPWRVSMFTCLYYLVSTLTHTWSLCSQALTIHGNLRALTNCLVHWANQNLRWCIVLTSRSLMNKGSRLWVVTCCLTTNRSIEILKRDGYVEQTICPQSRPMNFIGMHFVSPRLHLVRPQPHWWWIQKLAGEASVQGLKRVHLQGYLPVLY